MSRERGTQELSLVTVMNRPHKRQVVCRTASLVVLDVEGSDVGEEHVKEHQRVGRCAPPGSRGHADGLVPVLRPGQDCTPLLSGHLARSDQTGYITEHSSGIRISFTTAGTAYNLLISRLGHYLLGPQECQLPVRWGFAYVRSYKTEWTLEERSAGEQFERLLHGGAPHLSGSAASAIATAARAVLGLGGARRSRGPGRGLDSCGRWCPGRGRC